MAVEITHFIAVMQDITERHALGEALRQAQRLEASGQLAGGVASEFKKLLAIIRRSLQLLLMGCCCASLTSDRGAASRLDSPRTPDPGSASRHSAHDSAFSIIHQRWPPELANTTTDALWAANTSALACAA